MNTQPTILDRLDRMPPWRFTATLYCVRWLVVIPVAFVAGILMPGGRGGFQGTQISLLGALVLAPVLETVIECVVPYWIMRSLGWVAPVGRPWGFVAVAALTMMLLHVGAWPAAFLPSLVTGSFLGYTFAHFAPLRSGQAFLHTTTFHACINLVGCILITIA